MKIAGFNPNSFVDYPENIAAAVFVAGCNFDCWFCHNRWVIGAENLFSMEEILERIKRASLFLDGVVISGGEPTLEPVEDLKEFIARVKDMGLKVKLDTNGTRCEVLKELLPLVDYVAMDVKAPLSKYSKLTCIRDDELLSIKQSIKLIMETAKDYEFRTTFVPTLAQEDILEIAYTVEGTKRYFLQQYVPISEVKAYAPEFLRKTLEKVKEIIPSAATRGI